MTSPYTPSRAHLKHQTNKLIQQLEEDIEHQQPPIVPSWRSQSSRYQSNNRHVSFASNVVFASSDISINSDDVDGDDGASATSSSLRSRKATPHKKALDRITTASSPTVYRREKGTRLLDSGAVRLHVAYYTNPRRRGKDGSDRLLDTGAVRKVVTRHTTPRRLYATRKMWSPPPSTGRLKELAQSQQQNNNIDCEHNNTLSRNDETPSKLTPSKRSNAHIGGHKFRALLSPEFKNYNAENIDAENIKPGVVVSRALFH
eukprot:g13406.t1 g13406   contig8:619961-620924(-)